MTASSTTSSCDSQSECSYPVLPNGGFSVNKAFASLTKEQMGKCNWVAAQESGILSKAQASKNINVLGKGTYGTVYAVGGNRVLKVLDLTSAHRLGNMKNEVESSLLVQESLAANREGVPKASALGVPLLLGGVVVHKASGSLLVSDLLELNRKTRQVPDVQDMKMIPADGRFQAFLLMEKAEGLPMSHLAAGQMRFKKWRINREHEAEKARIAKLLEVKNATGKKNLKAAQKINNADLICKTKPCQSAFPDFDLSDWNDTEWLKIWCGAVEQILEALADFEKSGLVHGDINAGNVMLQVERVTREVEDPMSLDKKKRLVQVAGSVQTARLIDFGFTLPQGDLKKTETPEKKLWLGAWPAPESFNGAFRELGATWVAKPSWLNSFEGRNRSDVYGLGRTLLELLFGIGNVFGRPGKTVNLLEVTRQLLKGPAFEGQSKCAGEVEQLRRALCPFGEALFTLLVKMSSSNAEERPTASEALRQIRNFQNAAANESLTRREVREVCRVEL